MKKTTYSEQFAFTIIGSAGAAFFMVHRGGLRSIAESGTNKSARVHEHRIPVARLYSKRIGKTKQLQAAEGTRSFHVTQAPMSAIHETQSHFLASSSDRLLRARVRNIPWKRSTIRREKATCTGKQRRTGRPNEYTLHYPVCTNTNSPLSSIVQKLSEGIRYSWNIA